MCNDIFFGGCCHFEKRANDGWGERGRGIEHILVSTRTILIFFHFHFDNFFLAARSTRSRNTFYHFVRFVRKIKHYQHSTYICVRSKCHWALYEYFFQRKTCSFTKHSKHYGTPLKTFWTKNIVESICLLWLAPKLIKFG